MSEDRFFKGCFTHPRWLSLWAATLGFLLDATDVLLYVFALQPIRAEFGLSHAEAGLAASATLFSSAFGGVLAGWLADRIGRRTTLIYTILTYSLASAGTATSSNLTELVIWRAIVGLGLGGEWAAGATLVSEAWPAEHRAKAIGFMQSGWALGYMLAAGLSAAILPVYGWRVLFLAGIFPALLALAVRWKVPESRIWLEQQRRTERPQPLTDLFRDPLRRRTLAPMTLTGAVLFAYWGVFTWLPGFLSAPIEDGGAGLTLVRSSGFLIAVQAGAYAGYLSFGWLADRYGRRPVFAAYVLAAAALTPIYGLAPVYAGRHIEAVLLVLGPVMGFAGTGYFSLFGAVLAEIYPTRIRGSGQGLTYNAGRIASALAPYLVGRAADRAGIGAALGIASGFFAAAAALV